MIKDSNFNNFSNIFISDPLRPFHKYIEDERGTGYWLLVIGYWGLKVQGSGNTHLLWALKGSGKGSRLSPDYERGTYARARYRNFTYHKS
jgi:hypothetical protein